MTTIPESLAIALQHHQAGRLRAAEEIYRQILQLDSSHPEALHLLGVAAYQESNYEIAADYLARAIRANPAVATYHHHLGLVSAATGRVGAAVASFRKALQLAPDLAETHNSLGNALKEQGQLEDAITCYRRALHLKPDLVEAHNNLGNALERTGQHSEAEDCYSRALQLKPDHADSHWNHSLLMLLMGDFEHGWPEYEWRWQTKGFVRRDYRQPRWDGGQLGGKTILLHFEQGLGDTIQFIRYAPLVKARGGTVVVECQRPLLRLLAGCSGTDLLIGEGDEPPSFDVFAPLLSLPGIFETSFENIPSTVGYVSPSAALVQHWRERLGNLDGFRIGIGWQGNTRYARDRDRSFPLNHFSGLAQVPGVHLINLQKGADEAELSDFRSRVPLVTSPDELDEASGPFMDTAAIMKNLDLVICSDTALAHLAGALGVPVWVALQFAPDWRWFLDRDDSPWYPTMRLFRQKKRGNWAGVFEEIGKALPGYVQSRRPLRLSPPEKTCKCCGSSAKNFGAVDFTKSCEEARGVFLKPSGRQVPYYRCTACGFLFADCFDDWPLERYLSEIYNEGYLAVDPDFNEQRPAANAGLILKLFAAHKDSLTLLDYGGGNGRLVELLRAAGFRQAFSYDPLYDGAQKAPEGHFHLVCAFEVLEHMPDPLGGFSEIVRYLRDDGLLVLSTLLQPPDIGSLGLRWWYAAPRNGHISLHSAQSLNFLATRHGMTLHSLSSNLHVACRQFPSFAKHLIRPVSGAPGSPQPK